MAELMAQRSIRLADPADPDDDFMNDQTRTPAQPTEGPNRLTFHVPTQNTTLSLGKECADPPERHIADPGITGRTESHAHFHVLAPKTIVSLGNGAKSVGIEDFNPLKPYYNKTFNEKFKAASWKGYAMVTESQAWHEARADHDVVSLAGHLRIRAIHQQGTSDFYGGAAASVRSPGHVVIVADGTKDFAKWPVEGKVPDVLNEPIQGVNGANKEVWQALVSLIDTLAQAMNGDKGSKPNESEIIEKKVHVDAWGAVKNAIQGKVDGQKGDYTARGCLTAFASDEVKISAGASAHIHGQDMASIHSAGAALLTAGKTVAVTAGEFIGVHGGTGVSVRSAKSMDLTAGGAALVRGKASCELSSSEGPLRLTGKENVQLNSTTKAVGVYGKTNLYMGAGSGAGYGLQATDSKLIVGKITSNANKFGATVFDAKNQIAIADQDVKIIVGTSPNQSKVTMTGTQIDVKSVDSGLTLKHREAKLYSPGKVLLS